MFFKKNSIKFLLLAVIFALALSACGTAATPAAPAAAEVKPATAFGQASCAPNCAYKDMVMCYPQ
ncbi:MAG TPA: hypothetical protein VLR89_06315, partial [Anaerolineaceae bacterium]|nr:hypothetical protein [Anaerolineaceae bacterium]